MYRKAILYVGLIFCNIGEIISFSSMLLGMRCLYIRSYHPLIEILFSYLDGCLLFLFLTKCLSLKPHKIINASTKNEHPCFYI